MEPPNFCQCELENPSSVEEHVWLFTLVVISIVCMNVMVECKRTQHALHAHMYSTEVVVFIDSLLTIRRIPFELLSAESIQTVL